MSKSYYHTRESVQEYIRLSKDVNGEEIIEKLKKYLPDNSTILELGSGPGTDWELLNEHYQVTGSDYSQEFLAHLINRHPSGRFIHLDARDPQTHEKFNCLYSNKVLHHLKDSELRTSIIRQIETLNSNGLICHSFWRGKGDEIFKDMFVNYHTLVELYSLFSPGFEIVLLESYAEFEQNDSLLLIDQKKN